MPDPVEPTLFSLAPEPAPPDEPEWVGAFAAVAPEAPVDRIYTYLVPPELEARAQVGVRVQVPFRGRSVRGFLLERPERCAVERRKLRPLLAVIDDEPVLTPDVLETARWAATYYRAALGEVLAAAVPKAVGAPARGRDPRAYVWRTEAALEGRAGAAQKRALELLEGGPVRLVELREVSSAVLRRLEERGLVEVGTAPPGTEAAPPAQPPELTDEQRLALVPLLAALDAREHVTTLLFGITGSGKTEVYLRAIARVLEQGRAAIVLVPEISLTPQTLARFRARFGDGVAVLHSQLSGFDRKNEWERVRRGEARVVVGPRSAVWAPVRDLGLIVVDEEHEATYKQESAPRYHARDLAVVRGKLAGVPVLLGSATPSLETYHNVQRRRYRMSRLRSRPMGSSLPQVEIVDMGREWAEVKGAPLFSRSLLEAMHGALGRGERVLLFQNRRGFTTFLQCKACGLVLKCRQCDVALTYHRTPNATVCHFCDERKPPPGGSCPACLGPPLKQQGAGTERIEEAIAACFPGVPVGRLDTDVVRGGDSAEQVIERFRQGELRVLVGTQMIAKGLDIPEVTVVGVIAADTSLALPDFRSSERCFQLIAQVAGRAGRGDRVGVTVVQTFSPEHFAIKAAAQHHFEGFAAVELDSRRALGYPPYSRLLKVLLRGPQEQRVQAEAEALAVHLRERVRGRADVEALLGPAASPRAFLAGKFRWQLLVKGTPAGVRHVSELVGAHKAPREVDVIVDVDPYNLI